MKKSTQTPPRIAGFLLRYLTGYEDRLSLLGDFDEEYSALAREKGLLYAKIWYWRHCVSSIFFFIKDSFYWGGS